MRCPECKVDIGEHPASRCLDYWVAEVVLDLTCLKDPPYGILLPVDPQVKNYSTEIRAAWTIVEEVNQDSAMNLRWYNPDGKTSIFSVAFGFGKKIGAEASAAPLAICRAAIKVSEEGK